MTESTKKILGFVFVMIIIGLLAYLAMNNESPVGTGEQNPISYKIKISDTMLSVDIADNAFERDRGLGGRSRLREDEGMLFVFGNSDIYPFWMKDMLFPIDIIWISEEGRVVYIKKNATVESFPETFNPGIPAKYVLEVNSGFADAHNLKLGDSVSFLP